MCLLLEACLIFRSSVNTRPCIFKNMDLMVVIVPHCSFVTENRITHGEKYFYFNAGIEWNMPNV